MEALALLKSCHFSFLLLCITSSQLQLAFSDDVQTSSGPVQGTEIKFGSATLQQYLGIPFAKPPLDDLRFKKTEPVEPWTETLVADKMPPACMQYENYPFPWYDSEDGKSEDCLYLNIWYPVNQRQTNQNTLRPVIFWLYGGEFTVGSNRKPVYEGQALASEGGVVVVTVNYRMNAFGFFTSGTEEAPGNAGIYDMVEALKWVNTNIAAFGGDPEQVTLAGQGSGSIAVGLFCVSPLTKGLFIRVIMESGSPAYLLAENNTANLAKSQKVAEAVGCTDEDTTLYTSPEAVVDCVRNVDGFELAEAVNSIFPTSRSFLPSYGDEVLPTNARIALINGEFTEVDVLIGGNKDEGSFQITTSHPEVFGFFGEKDPIVNKSYGESLLRNFFRDFPDTDAVIEYYLGNVADDNYDEIREQVYTATGDYSILCPTVYFAETFSKTGSEFNNVYCFFFVHRPSTTPWAEWMGVVHYEEVQFVFGVPLQEPDNYTREEYFLSRAMARTWGTFATGGQTIAYDWPKYTKPEPLCYPLQNEYVESYVIGPHQDNCNFFRPYFGF